MVYRWRRWYTAQQARSRYRRGQVQLRKGHLAAACTTLTAALPHHPRPAEVHNLLGRVHWQGDNAAAALHHFSVAIALAPTWADAYGNRGLLYYHQGHPHQALTDWDQGLHHQPRHPLLRYNRGLLHLQQGDTTAALADFDQAIASDPNLATAYLHRGNLRARLGQAAAAQQDWELALCNDPNLTPARRQLAAVQAQRRHHQLAAHLQTALDLPEVALQVEVREACLAVTLHRPRGVGVNYFTLPERLGRLLAGGLLPAVRTLQLVGRVVDEPVPDSSTVDNAALDRSARHASSRVEWQQTCALYQHQPCPPAHWGWIGLTSVLFPPLGLAALVYVLGLKAAYCRGDYPTAQRASTMVLALCRLGVGVAGAVLALVVGYGAVAGFGQIGTGQPEQPWFQRNWRCHRPAFCPPVRTPHQGGR